MADNTKTKVLTLKTELDPSGIKSGADLIRAEVSKLTTDIGKFMGTIQKSINNALNPLSTASTELAKLGKSYSTSFNQVTTASTAAKGSIDNLNKSITSMSTRSKNLVTNMTSAAGAVKQYADASKGINSASISFRNYGDTVSNSMKLVNGQFDQATRLVRSAKNDIMDLGRIFVMTTAAMVTAVALPTKAFGDFEKELLTLKNLANDFTKGELEQFKKTALDVAYANGLMAKDIAASGIELVRLGLNAKETNSVLRLVADAALANSISIVKAAEVGLGATKAMGLGVKDLSMVLDVLTRAAVSSATDIEGLSQTFKYAAPIFNSAEQDIKELGKASIILSNNMIRNSQAGTTLRSMMLAFQAPTVQAQKAMKILGLEIQDTTTGKIKPFTQIVQEMSEKLKGVDTATKNFTLSTIFGKYALSGATALINSNTKAYEDADKAINDTTLSNEKMAAGMRQGVNFEFNRMRASINNSAIALGENLAPAVVEILQSITNLSEGFMNLPSSMQQSIADMTILTGKVTIATAGIVGLTLAAKTLINFAKEMATVLGISGAGGIVLWFQGIVTTLSTAFYSLASGFATTTAGAGALSVGITATAATVGTLVSGLVVLIGYVWALKEGWGALMANLAEEKAWETAIDGAKRLEEATLDAEKAARKLKDTQDAAANKKSTMTPLEIRRAASDRLNSLKGKNLAGDPYQDPQYKALMAAANAQVNFDAASLKAQELAASRMGLDPNSASAKRIKQLEQAQIDLMEAERKRLVKAGLLSDEDNLLMTAKSEALNRQLKGLQTEAADKEKEREENKANRKSMLEVEENIRKVLLQQKTDYEAIRDRVLKEKLNSNTDDGVNLGALAEEIAKTKVKLQRGVNECVEATRETFAAMGATTELINALDPNALGKGGNVDTAHKRLKQLVEKGLGTMSSTPTPGAIMIHPGHHMGFVPKDPSQLYHSQSSTSPKYQFKAGNNYLKNDPSVRYFSPSEKLFNPGALDGISRDNKALAGTIAEKEGAQQSIAKAIKELEKLRSVYGTATAEYKKYSDQIDILRNQSADAANDAIKKQIQVEEEARKKMETIYDENAKSLLNTQQEIDRKRAEMSKTTLTQKYNEINENYAAEVASYKVRFGAYKEFEALKKQADEKRQKELIKLGLEEQATFTKMLEDQTDARRRMMGTENEARMYDLQKEIMLLEKQREEQRGPEADRTKQLIDALIKGKKEELSVTKEQAQTDLVLYLNDQKLLRLQNELSHAQNDVNSGKITQAEYDDKALNLADEKFRAAKRELENAQARTDLDEAARIKRETDAKQKLTDAEIEYNAAVNSGLSVQLQKIKLDRARGAIGDTEAEELRIQKLDEALKNSGPWGQKYNENLKERNELLLKQKARQGDLVGVLDAYLKKTYNVNQASDVQIKLWDGMNITGEQLAQGIGALSSAVGDMIGKLVQQDQIMSNAINKMSEFGGAVAGLVMGIVSGNPIAVISGVVQAVSSLADSFQNLYPSDDKIKEQRSALMDSLVAIEAQAERTETRLKLLRGEITELQAAIANQATDAAEKQKKLDSMRQRQADLQKKQQALGVNGPMLSDINPLLGLIERGAKKAELDKTVDELTKLSKEISNLEKEIGADSLENAQTNNEAKKEIYLTDLDNFWATQKEQAKLTKETSDDVKVEFMANLSSRRAQMQTEVDDARKKGLDVKTIEEKHAAELASLWAQYAIDEADAKAKDAESGLTAEQEKNLKIEEERQEHLRKLYEMERQGAIDLLKAKASATFDKDDDVKADAEAERKAAGDRYQGIIEQVTGNSELEMKIKRQALQTYLIEVEQADKKEVRLLDENSKEKIKAARDVAMIEAQNSRDTTAILRQELANQFADLQDWKDREEALAKGDADRLIEIEKEFAAKKIQIQNGAEDKIRDSSINQLNEIKSIREEILKTQSMQYEDTIKQQEVFLLDLNKQRDDLQRQIEFYDNQIAKQRAQFNKDDKGMFQSMLGSVDIPAEIRAGLELIANPTGVPNNRFGRDSQRKAIQERIDMLTLENENLRDLEQRSEGDYWREESRIALIQAASANELLTDSVTSTKLTAKEKLEIQKDMAEAYKRFQAAQLAQIEDQYQNEREVANASLLQNKLDQDARNAIIADNKYQLDLLTQTYQKDISLIDKEILSLNMAHNTLKISVNDVGTSIGNMTPIINKVIDDYKRLQVEMQAVANTKFPQGPQSVSSVVSGNTGNTSSTNYTSGSSSSGSSGGLSSLGTIYKNSGQSAPAGYPITDGNYWYSTTSQMEKAHSLGLKNGGIVGMIPNQDKYKGDKFPIMPGVRGDAGELLVSPLSKLAEIMPGGNNYSILVTGNEFRDEVDFKRVLMDFGREQDLRNSMSTGQFYSNLRR